MGSKPSSDRLLNRPQLLFFHKWLTTAAVSWGRYSW